MERSYIEDQAFEKTDFTARPPARGTCYEYCTFINCNFANADLPDISFLECTFTGCNLSMANTLKTEIKDVTFKDCKLMGIHFEHCSEFLFAATFDNCLLNLSSFYKRNLKQSSFSNCSLHETDFTEADLTGVSLHNCDLDKATFERTVLEKADLTTAYNYSIDPAINKIRKAKFALPAVTGLLHKYDIEISL